MPINYDNEYPKLRMKYGKALQKIEELEAKLIRANYLIDELECHEGAEGWSEYLRVALAERNKDETNNI